MKPLIIITNDDGVYSPGLRAAAEAVADLGDLLIAGPAEQQTSMGRSRTRHGLGVIKSITLPVNGGSYPAYAINATPAMCVTHAVTELAPRKPDLVVSGINYGENLGFSLTSSGTVGAAQEGASYRIPAMAASLEADIAAAHARDYPAMDWETTKVFVRRVAEQILLEGLPDDVALLNLNVPTEATPDTPMHITRVSDHNYYTFFETQPERDFAAPFLPLEHKVADPDTLEPDSDIMAMVHHRVVSLSPVARGLTADRSFLKSWYDV